MSVVRLLDHGQVTIPKRFREALGWKKGEVAEGELDGESIVLTPQRRVRQKAWQELTALLDQVHQQNPGVREKDVVHEVLTAIAELRREDAQPPLKTPRRPR